MRYGPSEKLEIIRIVEESELSVRQTLKELRIHRSTFYNGYRRYLKEGPEGLGPKKPKAHDLITSPAYILMQAGDSFKNPTRRVHELW